MTELDADSQAPAANVRSVLASPVRSSNSTDVLNGAADFTDMLAEFGLSADDMRRLQALPSPVIDFAHPVSVRVAQSSIEGSGLFATRDYSDGQSIAPATIARRLTPAGRYINHASTPNAVFVLRANGDIDVIASRDIAEGEEITSDYRINARVFYASVNGCPFESVTGVMIRAQMRRLQLAGGRNYG